MSRIEVICADGANTALPPEVVADIIGAQFLVHSWTDTKYIIRGDDFFQGLKSGEHYLSLEYHGPFSAQSRIAIERSRCRLIG